MTISGVRALRTRHYGVCHRTLKRDGMGSFRRCSQLRWSWACSLNAYWTPDWQQAAGMDGYNSCTLPKHMRKFIQHGVVRLIIFRILCIVICLVSFLIGAVAVRRELRLFVRPVE
jgi:hypothetical protein